MNENQQLSLAISIASDAFKNTFDKGGQPYILHCIAVMDGVRHLGHKAMTVAILHDLLEDCPEWNESKLLEQGFDSDVVEMVKMITHKKNEDYLIYIGRVSCSEITRAIKISDLTHNMNPARLPDLTEKTMERMKKYHAAYQVLTKKDLM